MTKSLDAFYDLIKNQTITDEMIAIEKELKALEIIKDLCNLKVDKNKFGQCFLEGINILFPISQAQYDLLKEVLS